VSTFVLIPGAGGNGSFWSVLVPELERLGHQAIPVDIREDDPALGLPEYAAIVDEAIGARTDTILVAQSLGGFTAPMVSRPIRAIVLLNAMIPLPGETPGDWWDAVGQSEAQRAADLAADRDPEFDVERHFLHDVPDDLKAGPEGDPPRQPSGTPFCQPCIFETWPNVPIAVLTGRDDRFFPAAFQQRVARERLHIEPELLDGGHLLALSQPKKLAEKLSSFASQLPA
jgi:pimeloyl-ACP methyl ester carboxylesterase